MKTAVQSMDELHPVPGGNLVGYIYCPADQEGAPYLLQENLFGCEQHRILAKITNFLKQKEKI